LNINKLQFINYDPKRIRLRGTKQKFSLDSLECPSPRKSLVKGERFIRQLKRNQSNFSLSRKCIPIRSEPEPIGNYNTK